MDRMKDGEQKPQPGRIAPQDAERILDALERQEQGTQEKVRARMRPVQRRRIEKCPQRSQRRHGLTQAGQRCDAAGNHRTGQRIARETPAMQRPVNGTAAADGKTGSTAHGDTVRRAGQAQQQS